MSVILYLNRKGVEKIILLSSELVKQIIQFYDADTERLQTIFKDICQNSGLGFMKTCISDIVAQESKALGY